jgi:hypothetical protein
MTPELTLALRRGCAARAHLYGAEALILEKQAALLPEGDPRASLLAAASTAKRRYYRELAACDTLGGHPSPFTALGEAK